MNKLERYHVQHRFARDMVHTLLSVPFEEHDDITLICRECGILENYRGVSHISVYSLAAYCDLHDALCHADG